MAAGVFFDQAKLAGLRFGLVCGSDTAETFPAPGTMLGVIQKRQDWQQIIVETQVVPLTPGLGFGVDPTPLGPWVLDGVRITITHPPYIGSGVTTESWTDDFSALRSNLNFFEFEHSFEFVPGTWTMEGFDGEERLFSVTFEVVPAARLPQYDGICDGVSLTS